MSKQVRAKVGRRPKTPVSAEEVRRLIAAVKDTLDELEKAAGLLLVDGKPGTVMSDEKTAAMEVPVHLKSLALEIQLQVTKGGLTLYESTPKGTLGKRAKPSG